MSLAENEERLDVTKLTLARRIHRAEQAKEDEKGMFQAVLENEVRRYRSIMRPEEEEEEEGEEAVEEEEEHQFYFGGSSP